MKRLVEQLRKELQLKWQVKKEKRMRWEKQETIKLGLLLLLTFIHKEPEYIPISKNSIHHFKIEAVTDKRHL